MIKKTLITNNKQLFKLFLTEMEVMTKINHPNILHLHEYIETQNNYYLVLDYCNNGDVEQMLSKRKRLIEHDAVYFLKQIMNGFQELHRYNVMHRDFKLANIFLSND